MKNENEFTDQPVVLSCKKNLSSYLRKTPDNLSMERDQKEEIVDFKLIDPSPEIVLDNLRSQGKKIVYMELLDSSNDMIVDVKSLEPSHKMDDYDLTLPIEFGKQSFSHSDNSTKRSKTQFDTRPKPPNHDLVWKDSVLAKKEWEGDNGKVHPPISRESSLESVLFQINFENDMTFDGEANHLNWNDNSPMSVESNLKWVKQELSSKGKQEPIEEEFKLQRTNEDSMPELKQEIQTSDEFFGDCEDTEFLPSISQVKQEPFEEEFKLQRTSEDSMSDIKQEIQTSDEFFGDSEDTEFPPSISQVKQELSSKRKQEPTDEEFKLQRTSEDLMPELKQEIQTSDEFFGDSEDTEFPPSISQTTKLTGIPKMETEDENISGKRSGSNSPIQKRIKIQKKIESFVCSYCDMKFNQTEYLSEHIKSFHETSEPCKCLHCGYTCLCKKELSRHLIKVHKEFKHFKCPNCQLVFSSRLDLYKHRKTCASKCIFKCLSCNYASSSSKRNLLRHIKAVHEKIERFFCKYCKEEFSLRENFLNHMKAVHENLERFFCKFCKEEFSLRENLLNHLKSIHKSEFLAFKCLSCNYASCSKRNLLRHIKAVHEKIERFFCKFCKEEFSLRENLLNHLKSIHKSELLTFKCLSCNYASSSKQNLLRHIKAVHEKIERFFCKYCKEEFSIRENFLNHMKSIHKSEFTPFKCLSCNYASSYKIDLQKHISSAHRQINLVVNYCNECNLNFMEKEHLLAHIKSIHETSDPCKCMHCEYTCLCKKELSRHIITVHEELEHFKCPNCELVYINMTDLAKHMKIYPHMCPYCDYSYRFESALKNHLTVVHANARPISRWYYQKR